MAKEIKFNLKNALLGGVVGYIIFALISSTAIFVAIPRLIPIGTLLGVVVLGSIKEDIIELF